MAESILQCVPPTKLPRNDCHDQPPPNVSTSVPVKKTRKQPSCRPFKPPMTAQEAQSMKFKSFAPKMKCKINWALTMYSQWRVLQIHEHVPDLEKCLDLEKSSVQSALCSFITEVRKMDGTDFPPKTLYEIVVCIQMSLESHGIYWKFLEDESFTELKFMLDNEMKKRTREGLACPVKQADVITEDQENQLWTMGILGKDKPLQLLRTVLYLLGINLALRAGQEHRVLHSIATGHRNQLSFAVHDGKRVIIYKEDPGTKTNQGGIRHKKLLGKTVTIYPAMDRACCPVAALLKYHARLPPKRKCQALYLHPRCDSKSSDDVSYCDVAMGINKLQSAVKEMCEEAGFEGNFTNHSLRSTSATHMYQAGIDEQTICEITGYRSNAVRRYKRTSEDLKRKASQTISVPEKSHCETTV